MEKEELLELRKKLVNLSDKEKKERDLYLRKIAAGEIKGSLTGYPSVDKPWLKWYKPENISKIPKLTNVYDYFFDNIVENICLLEYYGKFYYKKDIKKQVDKYIEKFSSMGIRLGDTVSFVMLDVPEVFFMWIALSKMGATTNLIKFDESAERIKFMCEKAESKFLFVSSVPFIVEKVAKSISLGNKLEEVVTIPITNEMPIVSMVEMILNGTKNISKSENKSFIKSLKTSLVNTKKMNDDVNSIIANNEKIISFNEWNMKYKGIKNQNLINNADDLVSIIIYTGGTTGSPKAVQITHKNIMSSAHIFQYSEMGFVPGKKSLNILPPGPSYYLHATYGLMCCGVNVNMISNFSLDEYPSLVDKYKPNILLSGPILLKSMVDQDISKDMSFLTEPISGGDKLHDYEEIKFNEYVKSRGGNAIVRQGYGESESTGGVIYSNINAAKVGAIGIPLLDINIGIFEYQTYDEFSPDVAEKSYNEIGEICISGPIIMKGYKNDDEATNHVIRKHADNIYWLHTDDLGYIDIDGRVYHRGRAKRMLTRSGSKVWLGSLEDTIKTVPYIKDVCCVKAEDDVEREIPIAFIVLSVGAPENIYDMITERVREYQNEFYVPREYIQIEKIPFTEINKKVDYKKLENDYNEGKYNNSNYVKIKSKRK